MFTHVCLMTANPGNSGAPNIAPNVIAQQNPQFLIVPRLANGQLLSYANVTISHDTSATTLTPKDPTQNALLYAGSGNDTLRGGTGINLLFGGSGNDLIVGGPNGNDIFAGSGNETIIAGGGATYIKASSTALLAPGAGHDLFVVNADTAGATTIAGFNPALDHLEVVDSTGKPVSTSTLDQILGTAHTTSGGTQLTLGNNATLTIETATTSPSNPTATWFSQSGTLPTVSSGTGPGTPTPPPSSPPPPSNPTLTSSGQVFNAPSAQAIVTDTAGGNTIIGGSGGLNLIDNAGHDSVSTAANTGNTLVLGDADTVNSAGNDAITMSGSGLVHAGAGTLKFIGGTGADTIIGGGGRITAQSGAGGIDLRAGTGDVLLTEGSGADTVSAGGGNMTLDGGDGRLTFSGGQGNTVINQTTGNAMITTGGNMTINAGSGMDTITFDGNNPASSVTITDYSVSKDTLQFRNFGNSVITSASLSGNTEKLTLADGTSITLGIVKT